VVTFIGVVGGVITYGFAGLFVGRSFSRGLGLMNAWIYDKEKSAG